MQRYTIWWSSDAIESDDGKWVKAADAEREVQYWKDCAERWADGHKGLSDESLKLAAAAAHWQESSDHWRLECYKADEKLATANARIKELEEASEAQRKIIRRLAGKSKLFEIRGDELVGVWSLEEARRDGWLV